MNEFLKSFEIYGLVSLFIFLASLMVLTLVSGLPQEFMEIIDKLVGGKSKKESDAFEEKTKLEKMKDTMNYINYG